MNVDLAEEIRRAARSTAAQWPGVIDADDVEQQTWMRLLEAPTYRNDLEKMDEGERKNALHWIGHQIALGERDDYDLFAGQWHYSTNEVRQLLGEGVLTVERKRPRPEYVDLDEAFDALDEHHAETLWRAYASKDLDRSTGAARKGLQRAVDALTDGMNHVYRNRVSSYAEGPGSRQALSNAQAQALTARQWGP